ncbi:MAG TPA: 16S rRNA (guanine(527)-N(7))-methyltransferase RsmG [Stellaceae bacterium]|nr:16S rRNA (guanine(527)-N(7))-methyltransferase RsmG [Stellaceae bacterium]
MTPEAFAKTLDVSRETLDRLQVFVSLLTRWNARINLVSAGTLADVWRRHILDSAQLIQHIDPAARVMVDLGSGAGLPGMILAILGVPQVHLIEADQRKAAFLREAARITQAPTTVHASRAESVKAFAADVITARALAPLPQLLAWGAPFVGETSVCLFLKGQGLRDELTAAEEKWIMRTQILASLADPTGHILRVEGLRAAH